jgi:hypothetical protein|nr:MAG TPA: hypothetical protein [Caudoviricetes sp.]
MTKYESIYSFDVIDEIARGEVVFMIDRKNEVINRVNDMTTSIVAYAIKDENKDNRYEFYKEV